MARKELGYVARRLRLSFSRHDRRCGKREAAKRRLTAPRLEELLT